MKLKKYALKSAILASLVPMLVLLLAGCGEKRAVADPPVAEPDLVMELMDALSKKKHNTALNKIERLSELKKNSVFLAKLKNLEESNLAIVKVRELLDKDQPGEALKLIRKAIKDYGRHDELLSTEKELKYLVEIKSLTESLNNPQSSSEIITDALKLRKIANTYKTASVFKPYVNDKIALAYRMKKWEKQRMIFDLYSDIKSFHSSKDGNVDVLFAQLAIVDPDSLYVKKWLKNSGKQGDDLILIEE